jgi:hypothetical protein
MTKLGGGCKTAIASILLMTASTQPATAVELDWTRARSLTHWAIYADVGYLLSSNQPGNHAWLSKGTTNVLDRLKINNVAVAFQKHSAPDAPWGIVAGLQAGQDVDNQVSDAAIGSAETLKHLYYSFVSYLFEVGHGLVLGGGLIPGHIGYEAFHAIDNPTYTRIYGVDNVPYFNFGVGVKYADGEPLSGTFLVLNGWDYLARPNDVPSYGVQLTWQPSDDGQLTQNFYYGPDQADTGTEFWRFVTNTIVEWEFGEFLVVGSIGYGTEKQADLTGNPTYDWAWGALWLKWQFREEWRVVLRPEFFRDDDGVMTGSQQNIRAVTMGFEYRLTPNNQNDISCRLEYRYDRSSGPGGGFYDGDANALVPEQHLFIGAVMWKFDSRVTGL